MNTGTREAMVLSEVLRSNSCMIDHYNFYLGNCQDQQLRSILDRQQRHTLDSVQRLMQMMQSHGIDTTGMPLPSTMTMTASAPQAASTVQYGTQMTTQQYGTAPAGTAQYGAGAIYTAGPPATGTQMAYQQSTRPTAINDRVIAEGALLFHKCSADTSTRAALESSEPHIRSALTNMARNCIEMSYELYNYMSQRGWYQLPATPQHFISHSPKQQQYPPQ
ncbi:spore coat protein [Desulfallas sp. Bu1-1]|uniref:spore coat protein n=1 Tax=Desulfallas sp. Bu1-1 TaxID=2787620 RepID=UPI001FAC173F|nr:spore coat protein [Desulfallas sp. Bu1-1]